MVTMNNTTFWLMVVVFVCLILWETKKEFDVNRSREEQLKKDEIRIKEDIELISGIIKEELLKGENLGGDRDMGLKNKNNLGQLLEVKASESDYDVALEMLVKEVKDLYKDFHFKFLKPQDGDFLSGYAVVFELHPKGKDDLLHTLFKYVVGKNMSEGKLADLFVEEVKKGNVIELGDVILDETGTGMSSLLTGEDVTIVISFETEDYQAKRKEQEELEDAEAEEQKAKQAKFEELRVESHKALVEASVILKEMSKELVEKNPEYVEAYERVKELY